MFKLSVRKKMEAEARWLRSVLRSCKTREQWETAENLVSLWFRKWRRHSRNFDLMLPYDKALIKNRLIELGYNVGYVATINGNQVRPHKIFENY